MLKISGTKILLTRGDSAYVTLTINDQNGDPYELMDGDVVKCQVRTKPNIGELIIDGNVSQDVDGNIVWHILPTDTKDLDVGKYWWDAQLETAGGDVFTFITSSLFKITDEVTMDA